MKEFPSRLSESVSRLDSRTSSEYVLTSEFGLRVRSVANELSPDISFQDLYMATHTRPERRAGLEWFEFVTGLSRNDKSSLTRALDGISTKTGPLGEPLTLGEFSSIQDRLVGRKIGQITADFLTIAFGERDLAEEY